MLQRSVRRVVLTAVIVLFAVGCGSGSGSVNPSSSVSRPTQAPTIPDATVRPPATGAPTIPDATVRPPATGAPTIPDATVRPPATSAPIDPTEAPAAPTEAPAAPTEAPTVQESVAPAPGPVTTAPVAASDEGSSPWWPWLLAALAVAAAVIGVIALVRRSPKAAPLPSPSPTPTAPTAAVLAQSDEISTQLVGLAPAGVASVAGADASSLAVLITIVEQLMTSAPDETSRRALATVHEPMRSLHRTLDAIALTPHPPSDAEVAAVRAQATALHSATSLARATLLPPSPGPTV